MYDALMTLIEKILNVAGNLVVYVFLFQWGIKRLWLRYPLSGFKKSFFLFVALLGVYGFVRGLVIGW